MTVYSRQLGKSRKTVVGESEVYKTSILPGFELPLGELLSLADSWKIDDDSRDAMDD